jgi:hypothetical protein
MNTFEIMQYYARLLIIQYITKPKAFATIEAVTPPLILVQESVQLISFSSSPELGEFTLFYGDEETAAIPVSAEASDVQTALRALTGLSQVNVSGSFFTEGFRVNFIDVLPPALILTVGENTLVNGPNNITITITEIDETLPLAVQNGYNLSGDSVSEGSQLDILGKYAGVSRSAKGFTSQITLDDNDYLSLIRIAIIKNSAQSDLATIQQLLFDFFPNKIYVFDFKNMRMSYLLSSTVGGQDLVELFITQNLLPVPMAVQLAVIIYAPIIDSFFGFSDYELPVPIAGQTPLNDYDDYSLEAPWLAYENGIFPS